jgi:hypothetical protein
MLYPHLEEKLHHARHALKQATRENILELCKQYLALLAEYRSQLYKLPGTPDIDRSSSSSSRKDVSQTRQAVRLAIETTTRERNRTEVLLLSFCTVSGYEAVELFNRLEYEGHGDWELRAGGVKFSDGTDNDLMTIQEAVDTASLLRRDEYIAQNAAQAFKEAHA